MRIRGSCLRRPRLHYQLLCVGVAFDDILDNYFDERLKNDFSRYMELDDESLEEEEVRAAW